MAAQDDFTVQSDNDFTIDNEESLYIKQSSYHDLDEFNQIMKKFNTAKDLSMLNINARSLVKNFGEFTTILSDLPSSFDVITVEETWLSDSLEPLVTLNGYKLVTKHKSKCKEGGGLGIYIKDGIDFKVRRDLSCPKEYEDMFDYLFIEIKQSPPTKNTIIGVFYRPPGGDTINILTDHLKALLPKIIKENTIVVLTSDMNINLLKCVKHKPTSYYYDTLLTNGFTPKITVPTRVTHTTATLIDHLFTNEDSPDQSFAGTITSSMTDHYFNFIFLKNSKTIKYPKNVTYRPYTDKNISKFNEKLMNTDFNEFYSIDCPNEAYEKLIDRYNTLLDETIPVKTTKFNKYKHSFNPWATKGLRISIKHRDKLHSKIKKAKNDKERKKLEHTYDQYRSFLHKIIKAAKRQHVKERFEKCRNDSKSLWLNINSILGKSNNKKDIPLKINDENGVTLSNLQDITNAFNKYYVNVGSELAKKIGQSDQDYMATMKNTDSYKSFYLYPTGEQEVENIIKLLKPKTSAGQDNISPKILKKLYHGLVNPCVHIINLSLSTGIVPDAMKLAKVIPIFKRSGSDEIMKNYRPVSLLPVLSKVLERIVYNRLFHYFMKHKIFSASQYGFQPNLSTEHAILELQDRIVNIMNKKECCIGVFMDLSKAFDTLDHKILLDKLYHYGVRGIAHDWFRNYLKNRKQYVYINEISSERLSISCGVPQGSILGPLLFLIYVNDLASVSKHAITILFADDTNLIYNGTTYNNLKIIIEDDLSKISDWFRANKLALNESKTKLMIFHTQLNKPPDDFQIILNNVELERVDSTKFLGVLIQENLQWNTHINYICNKVSKATAILAKLKHYLPKYVLLLIYNSLCLSHIMYALSVWGGAPISAIGRLNKIHKKGIRHVCNAKYNAHTEPLFKRENILQLHDLFKLQCVKIMYKKIQKTLHSYHSSKLTTNFEITQKHTRQKENININRQNNIGKINSINYKVGTSWNELDPDVKKYASKTASTFIQHVKRVYFSKYLDTCTIQCCYICKR